MNFDPGVFGEGFHQFVQKEMALFGSTFGVAFHIISFIILFLVFRYGNRYRKVFTFYFTLNWIFLFGYWGIYAIIYWLKVGIPYLAVYSLTPVLLGLIVYSWINEISNPLIDLDFKSVSGFRFFILIILLWGLWYPTYNYGQGFIFTYKDALFSNYGMMPCPTTMVALSLMTLKYPDVNKRLFNLFTTYALFIGTATVISGWIPDIPFIVLGLYSLSLIIIEKRRGHVYRRISKR